MTSPAPTDPYASSLTPTEQAVVAAVTVFLASAAAVQAVTLPTALVARLAALGLSVRAVRAAGRLILDPPLTGRRRTGSPARRFGPQTMVRRMAAAEPDYRARYLLAASRRLTQAIVDGEFTAGMRREHRYLGAHRRAGKRRARIAADYDRVARRATYLRWRAVMDDRTSPDCAARNGSTWHRDNPPFPPPGAQHPACRCIAVPA